MAKYYGAGKEDLVRRRVKRVDVAGSDESSGAAVVIASWQNPEDRPILVSRVVLDITTAGGGVNTNGLDVGVVADASSTANDIIDALDPTSTGVTDHLLVSGAGAGGVHRLDENGGTNDHITVYQGDDVDHSALVGKLYIEYLVVEED